MFWMKMRWVKGPGPVLPGVRDVVTGTSAPTPFRLRQGWTGVATSSGMFLHLAVSLHLANATRFRTRRPGGPFRYSAISGRPQNQKKKKTQLNYCTTMEDFRNQHYFKTKWMYSLLRWPSVTNSKHKPQIRLLSYEVYLQRARQEQTMNHQISL